MERTRCPQCGAPAPFGAIGCAKCHIVFSEYERQQAEALAAIDASTADRIALLALSKLWKPVSWALFVLTTVFGIGIWRACVYVDGAVKERFAEPEVSKTFERVASEKAAEILSQRVEPAVKSFEAELNATKANVAQSATDTRAEFRSELENLRGQVNYLKVVRDIQGLEAEAILGEYAAYERLHSYKSDDLGLESMARVAEMQTELAYLGHSRVGGVSIWPRPDGKQANDQQLTAAELAEILASDPQWPAREAAAFLLGSRHQQGVPEALIQAMQTDANLWVRHEALTAFWTINAALSQRPLGGVFGFDQAAKWYAEHQEEVQKTLAPRS